MRAAEHAAVSVAAQACTLAHEIFRDAVADDLAQRAHAVRGLVAYALAILADLEYVAGRLDALAALRAAIEVGAADGKRGER